MLLTKEVEVRIVGRTLKYFTEKGYDCKVGQIITVKVDDLQECSGVKVKYKCTGCGKTFETPYAKYTAKRHAPYAEWGDFCVKCAYQANVKWQKEHDPEGYKEDYQNRREKAKETCIEKYGVDNPMKTQEVQEKFRRNFKEKYGANTPMEVPEFRKKLHDNMQKSDEVVVVKRSTGAVYYQIHGAPVSKNQKHFWELYGGELNKSLDPGYIVDVYLGNNIYFEYDGSGHNLAVQLGQLTPKEFENKEIKRYKGLKYHGYKQFVFVLTHQKQRLPSDEALLKIKDIALEYLFEDDHNWIKFDYDNKIVKTKQGSFPFDYANPQRPPQL